jgi:benzoyl-CoA reductase/2-hydroxyglutaryl-CoA dehydratase subunit BcrC/BadD/HgdB
MYDSGLKRIYLWVKTEPSKVMNRLNVEAFEKKVEQLISMFSENEQKKLFALIIKVIEGKKEVLELRKKNNVPRAKGGKKGRG